ncbi:hypothetical protein, partial [Paracoccus pantotrophus]|uniref:hypothetical protein n=1 Tax=Paracoccus pantotrophus TaxID=82367 RepID=UPI0023E3EC58
CLHAGSSFSSVDPPYAPVSETGTTSPYAFAEIILEEVGLHEASESAMDNMAEALEDAARMLRRLSYDFHGVKDAVPLVCDKDDAAWVFDKDDGSTRYVLPVIEQKEAA